MDKHTICLLNDSFPPTVDGVANAVLNYAEIIEKQYGHSVVVTPSVPGADDSGYDFPVLRYPSIDTRKKMGYVTGYPVSPEVTYRIREEGSELLHLHCPATSAILARQMRETADLPLIMTYHTKYDIDIANLVHSNLLQETAIAALIQNIEACDEVWTVSRGAGENLRSLGFKGDYIIMENGVDLTPGRSSEAEIHAATSGYDLPEGVPVFLFVGRIMWYKGLRIILDALTALKQAGTDFRMVFIGEGTDRNDVISYAEAGGLGKVCFFTGALTDRNVLRAWYSRADLFLFPSTFDTNGLVVREAAACTLPAVMVEGSCAAEGITDGQNGFLIEENAASMAAKLEELCASSDIFKRVGAGALDDLYISWDDSVKKAMERYEIVLENHRRGLYNKKPTLQTNLLRMHGETMNALGTIGAINHFRGDYRDIALEKINSALSEVKAHFARQRSALWEFLDRYL